jgi:hypothetical protein
MGSSPISAADWGFECFYWNYCGLNGEWIPTTSQPGTVRLWQAGTEWAFLNTASGTYDWTYLDRWLDLIAEHQPRSVIYTFGLTPCWISTGGCDFQGWGNGHNFSNTPPKDLSFEGSPSFNAFVTALVQHCSPAGNCDKDYIKHWEMWNEADLNEYWTGTAAQLYDMFAPVIPIIRSNIPGAIVSTPPVCGGKSWMVGWMALENTYGRLSDYFGFHVYLQGYTPEARMTMIQRMVATKNAYGWTTTPWINTETNFATITFACPSQYTAEECDGQLVRWHVLQYAYQGGAGGAFHVGWFEWKSIDEGGYDTYYYTMMQWLVGGTFAKSCTNQRSANVWSCLLTEADGRQALIVWDASGPSRYKPAREYVAYRYFNGTYGGAIQGISPGQSTTIGVVPIMFESRSPDTVQ